MLLLSSKLSFYCRCWCSHSLKCEIYYHSNRVKITPNIGVKSLKKENVSKMSENHFKRVILFVCLFVCLFIWLVHCGTAVLLRVVPPWIKKCEIHSFGCLLFFLEKSHSLRSDFYSFEKWFYKCFFHYHSYKINHFTHFASREFSSFGSFNQHFWQVFEILAVLSSGVTKISTGQSKKVLYLSGGQPKIKSQKSPFQHISYLWGGGGGGHWPRKGVWGCAAFMTNFFFRPVGAP